MGWGFRRSKSIGPFRISLGKAGVGISVGAKGARVGVGADGRARTSVSIPGAGLSYRGTVGASAPAVDSAPSHTRTSPFVAILALLLATPVVLLGVALALVAVTGPRPTPTPMTTARPSATLSSEQHLAEAERLLALDDYTNVTLSGARVHLDAVPQAFERPRRRAAARGLADGERRIGEEAVRQARAAIREARYDDARAALAEIPASAPSASQRQRLLREIDRAEHPPAPHRTQRPAR